ncbi:class I SAM-dependent methyltransferase [Nocardiopsis alba]|uniref:class I SAM-dependent methyltransferase n=1 Tax=Nocardiopsis alba TaxID=53437 RepID=UPI0033B834C0
MMTVTDLSTYWDRYAGQLPTPPKEEALKQALRWCQYDDHGPGSELLGSPESSLELGCGRGDAVAALANTGVEATGVDLSTEHIRAADRWWGEVTGARFVQGDVVDFLSKANRRWDAAYSTWGAVWFTDPRLLFPLVHERLSDRGRLVFAHAPAISGAYGVQGMYANGFRGRAVEVHRWAYEPHVWEELLRKAGFSEAEVWVEPAPEPDHVGTLIGVGYR